MGVRSDSELIAWQPAVDRVEVVYRATRDCPREEVYGITNQLRRAAVSIPSNIAEGQGRRSTRDFLRFLFRARGPLRELETQTLIAERLGYLSTNDREATTNRADEVGRLLNGHPRSLERRDEP
jgi:four helix bundle protein